MPTIEDAQSRFREQEINKSYPTPAEYLSLCSTRALRCKVAVVAEDELVWMFLLIDGIWRCGLQDRIQVRLRAFSTHDFDRKGLAWAHVRSQLGTEM